MQTEEIRKLIGMLDWNSAQVDIDHATNKLVSIDSDKIPMLILPEADKRLWANAALVIKKIGYPRIKEHVPNLLEWLKDVNWPGANIVMELLESVEKDFLISCIEDTLIKAKEKDDEMWLGGLKILLKKCAITKSDFVHRDLYAILEAIDWT